ncbi:tetratricopeptide repeat protein [bacterium]|nr:tetratricopeptide repeat protein [candidate division CSSED10-310 bacterium]
MSPLHRWPMNAVILTSCVAAAAFSGVLGGTFVWDDEYVIRANLMIRDLRNLPLLVSPEYFAPAGIGHYTRSGEESYRPLTTLTHFIDYALFGLRPAGYHAGNLLLHCLTGTLLLLYLHRLGHGKLPALTAALLFAVHPAHVETVATISYRDDLLAASLLLASLLFLSSNRLLPAAALGLAAMLAKEMAVTLVLLAAIAMPLLQPVEAAARRPRVFFSLSRYRRRTAAAGLLALTAATACYLVIAFVLLRPPAGKTVTAPPAATRLMTAPRLATRYLELFVAPARTAVDPDFPVYSQPLDLTYAPALTAALLPLALALLAHMPPLVRHGLLWFYLALLPVIGIHPLANPFAERYLYLPSMGLCALAGCATTRLAAFPRLRRPALAAGLVILLCFAGLDHTRSAAWHDEISFYRAMIHANPHSHKGYSGLGTALFHAGHREASIDALSTALRMDPGNAIAGHNLGCAHWELGNDAAARQAFETVLATTPDFIESRYHLALVLRTQGDVIGAERELTEVLSRNPRFIPAAFVLASMEQADGRYRSAATRYRRILELDPNYAKALKNLGILAHTMDQDAATAAACFRRYLQLVPNDPQRAAIEQVIAAGEADRNRGGRTNSGHQ